MRPNNRKNDELRKITLEVGVSDYAEGSCMVSFGNTRLLCTASVDDNVPRFLRNTGTGWVTAEYGMLPRSTHSRMRREAAQGKQGGRTVEIQRLIGRSLRAVTDLKRMGERQIIVDCDVINADGGTRTAAITGGYVALYFAFKSLVDSHILHDIPLTDELAAVSCGICKGETVLDLEYSEDSKAEADANFVLTGSGKIVEIQATAEDSPFSEEEFFELMRLAKKGTQEIVSLQRELMEL